MGSKPERVLEAIKALLMTVPSAKVERNSGVPEKIPAGGLFPDEECYNYFKAAGYEGD